MVGHVYLNDTEGGPRPTLRPLRDEGRKWKIWGISILKPLKLWLVGVAAGEDGVDVEHS